MKSKGVVHAVTIVAVNISVSKLSTNRLAAATAALTATRKKANLEMSAA